MAFHKPPHHPLIANGHLILHMEKVTKKSNHSPSLFLSAYSTSIVSGPLRFHHPTLCFFPDSYGKKNCYLVPSLPNPTAPTSSTHLSFMTITMASLTPRPSTFPLKALSSSTGAHRGGTCSDLFTYIKDDEADVCFYSLERDAVSLNEERTKDEIERRRGDSAVSDVAVIIGVALASLSTSSYFSSPPPVIIEHNFSWPQLFQRGGDGEGGKK